MLQPWFGAWMQGRWGRVVLGTDHGRRMVHTRVSCREHRNPLAARARTTLWERGLHDPHGTGGSTRGSQACMVSEWVPWPPALRVRPSHWAGEEH